MKKTVSVNIKGISFTIEEDAYEQLQDYLDRLTVTLGNQNGSKEILEDIELRIAELFNIRLNDSKTVIELIDVEEILANLGQPEDFVDLEDEEDDSEDKKIFEEAKKGSSDKRLFRDQDNAVIAGVCSGIANYFSMDVVIIRIIFFVIFFFAGFGVPLYIILWIAVPKAKNTIDRLRMKGRPVTVENVRTEVENAADKIKTESRGIAKKMRDKDYKGKASRGARIFTSIIGVGLILFGLLHLITFLVVILGGFQMIPIQSDQGFLSITELGELVLSNPADIQWTWIGGLMMIMSFILFFFLLGSILLFRLRSKWGKLSLLGLFIIGLVGFFMCLSVGMRTTRDIAIDGEIEYHVGNVQSTELIILPQLETLSEDETYSIKSNGQFGLMTLEGDQVKEYGIRFEYVASTDSLFHIYQSLSARSHNHTRAVAKSKNIHHSTTLVGDSLLVDAEYSFPKKDKLRDQDVVIVIQIPQGGQVKFKDQIVYLNSDHASNGRKRGYYKESGYLRGDGTYRHYDSDWDWHVRLDNMVDDIEMMEDDIEEEIDEIF